MAPQIKGIIPAHQLAQLLRAQALSKEAKVLYEQAVTNALNSGGSVREVGERTGLSTTTVQRYGHAHGWPSQERRTVFEADSVRSREFRARMDELEAALLSEHDAQE